MVSYSTDLVFTVGSVSRLFYLSIVSYTLTFLIASSSLLEPLRALIKKKLPWLQIGNNKHAIECRMCVGGWISLIAVLFLGNYILDWFVVWGISYFMATQER